MANLGSYEQEEIIKLAKNYLDAHWEEMLSNISTLVKIPSIEDLTAARKGMPFGPKAAEALSCALNIAENLGLSTQNMDGYIGIADFEGQSPVQIGIIGHVDVVDAGPGWTVNPFDITERDGYLLGRGVADDKGPTLIALHAVAFWVSFFASKGLKPPRTVRFLIGCNEETGMGDVIEYRRRYPDPAFLFTPDADFPVCYGEKGIANLEIHSAPIQNAAILEISGGLAVNAVPGIAQAKLACSDPQSLIELSSSCSDISGIEVSSDCSDAVLIVAKGKSAHASTPNEGINAIGILADFLLKTKLCNSDEAAFLSLVKDACEHTDGSSLGIDSSDDDFGPLTLCCGIISKQGDKLTQTLDVRYPSTIESSTILSRCNELSQRAGGTAKLTLDKPPFLVDPNSAEIQALLSAYNETTGEDASPFTMGGGTYARMFSKAASFGPEKPWVKKPDWLGAMHGPDEGISIELLREAFMIYVLTIGRLLWADLD